MVCDHSRSVGNSSADIDVANYVGKILEGLSATKWPNFMDTTHVGESKPPTKSGYDLSRWLNGSSEHVSSEDVLFSSNCSPVRFYPDAYQGSDLFVKHINDGLIWPSDTIDPSW